MKVVLLFLSLCLFTLNIQAQRINADGRKMVKNVKYYKWRGEKRGYELQETYSMDYNAKDDLVRLYQDNCNGFEPYSYIRKGNKIIGLNKGCTECDYSLNSNGHIVSAKEYALPHEKDDPYYTTYTFTYDENDKLSFMTEKVLYNITGQQYKENIEDRVYVKFEYEGGGMYSYDGGVNAKGDYFYANNTAVRTYDTHAPYDINFNIEAREFARGKLCYTPWLTEWIPTFPECLIRKTDNGGNIRLYNWEYDQNGNIIAMTITYGSGGTHGRYEIEYVY